jgi:hypothetical protein
MEDMVERILEDEKATREAEDEQQRGRGKARVEMDPHGNAPKL